MDRGRGDQRVVFVRIGVWIRRGAIVCEDCQYEVRSQTKTHSEDF